MPEFKPEKPINVGVPYSAKIAACGKPPVGWRFRAAGEVIAEGDIYFSSMGYFCVQTGGATIRDTSGWAPVLTPTPTSIPPLAYKIAYQDDQVAVIRIENQKVRQNFQGVGCAIEFLSGKGRSEYVRSNWKALIHEGDTTIVLQPSDLHWLTKGLDAYIAKHTVPVAPPRTVTFHYKGGSYNGFRTIRVEKECATYIEGHDIAADEYRKYRKDKIVGKVMDVKVD